MPVQTQGSVDQLPLVSGSMSGVAYESNTGKTCKQLIHLSHYPSCSPTSLAPGQLLAHQAWLMAVIARALVTQARRPWEQLECLRLLCIWWLIHMHVRYATPIVQGKKQAKPSEPTAAEKEFRRKSWHWLAGAAVTTVGYILFSNRYLSVSCTSSIPLCTARDR